MNRQERSAVFAHRDEKVVTQRYEKWKKKHKSEGIKTRVHKYQKDDGTWIVRVTYWHIVT